jgi:hypothetical protein
MVARGPGAVGCAHCTQLGAVVPCASCKRLVCPGCAADWSTCEQPCSRTFKLARGERLLDVDPSGRLGLVARDGRALRYLELRGPRWVEGEVPALVRPPEMQPRLTSTGKMFQFEYGRDSDGQDVDGLAISSVSPTTKRLVRLALTSGNYGAQMSEREDVYWHITARQRVVVLRERPDAADVTREVYEPLPRKVLSCAFVDDAHGLLASASWGEIIVHRMVGAVLEQVCYLTTTGAVEWVAIAFPYLAALVRGGAEHGLLLWKISSGPGYPSMLMHLAERVRMAALSRDGRYLAAAFDDHRVFVRDIEDGGNTSFDDHTAAITLMRFVGADHQLITADEKGRVALRTHGPSGYLRDLVEVPIR